RVGRYTHSIRPWLEHDLSLGDRLGLCQWYGYCSYSFEHRVPHRGSKRPIAEDLVDVRRVLMHGADHYPFSAVSLRAIPRWRILNDDCPVSTNGFRYESWMVRIGIGGGVRGIRNNKLDAHRPFSIFEISVKHRIVRRSQSHGMEVARLRLGFDC